MTMARTLFFLLVSACLVVTGCAGTGMRVQTEYVVDHAATVTYSVDPKAEVSPQALDIFKQRLESQFAASGLMNADEVPTRSVQIVITNYYMRHGATRALLGIMAGADNMQSSITVSDTTTNVVLGAFSVESTNPTAMFTSKGLIEDHADKIVRYVTTGGE